MGQFQSRSGSGVAGSSCGSGSHCYRLMVHIDVDPLAGGWQRSQRADVRYENADWAQSIVRLLLNGAGELRRAPNEISEVAEYQPSGLR
jgi:hypothetical protein